LRIIVARIHVDQPGAVLFLPGKLVVGGQLGRCTSSLFAIGGVTLIALLGSAIGHEHSAAQVRMVTQSTTAEKRQQRMGHGKTAYPVTHPLLSKSVVVSSATAIMRLYFVLREMILKESLLIR
jgi:hypothetical protein